MIEEALFNLEGMARLASLKLLAATGGLSKPCMMHVTTLALRLDRECVTHLYDSNLKREISFPGVCTL